MENDLYVYLTNKLRHRDQFFFLTRSSDLRKNDGYLIFFYPDLNLESPRSRQGSEI